MVIAFGCSPKCPGSIPGVRFKLINMKEAYLTIDDAPSNYFKEKIDFLVANKIPAIIFCRGELCEKNIKAAGYAIEKGFILGNHSYTHPHFSELTIEQAREQIVKTDKIIESAYKMAGVKRQMKLFRFPYGDKGGELKEKIQDILKESGYKQPVFKKLNNLYSKHKKDRDLDVLWTIDIEDWKLNPDSRLPLSYEEVISNLDSNISFDDKNSTEIVLIHDHNETTEYFYKIISYLKDKKKIKFVSTG